MRAAFTPLGETGMNQKGGLHADADAARLV
jgi:hypothetical protein